jgi:hydrogenase expression/formation protein HypC
MCLGIPGEVVDIVDADKKLATVSVSGIKRVVNVACLVDDEHPPHTLLGEWVLVHVGFAMSRIDKDEAEKTLSLLAELGEAQQELAAMQNSTELEPSER